MIFKPFGAVGGFVSDELSEGDCDSIMVPLRSSPFRLCSRCSKVWLRQNRKRSNSCMARLSGFSLNLLAKVRHFASGGSCAETVPLLKMIPRSKTVNMYFIDDLLGFKVETSYR